MSFLCLLCRKVGKSSFGGLLSASERVPNDVSNWKRKILLKCTAKKKRKKGKKTVMTKRRIRESKRRRHFLSTHHLSISFYIYIYMCVCVYVCVYIYIYIYIYMYNHGVYMNARRVCLQTRDCCGAPTPTTHRQSRRFFLRTTTTSF